MNETLTFYTHPMSRGRIVRWMLEEVGEPYETVFLDFLTTLKEEAYLNINPMGKVPAIVHGDVVVTECAAICAYLADTFPEKRLAPPSGRRGAYYRWMLFAAGPLEQSAVNSALGFAVSIEQEGMSGYGTLARVLDTLEQLLAVQEFVAGEYFTAADVYIAAQLQWNMTMKVVDERDVFIDYSTRMHSRAASTRAAEIDDKAFEALKQTS